MAIGSTGRFQYFRKINQSVGYGKKLNRQAADKAAASIQSIALSAISAGSSDSESRLTLTMQAVNTRIYNQISTKQNSISTLAKSV